LNLFELMTAFGANVFVSRHTASIGMSQLQGWASREPRRHGQVVLRRRFEWWLLRVPWEESSAGAVGRLDDPRLAILADLDIQIVPGIGGSGVAGFEAFGAALFGAIETLADPLEPAGDGHFVTEFADLIAEEGEIGELPFEVGFLGLEPFEFNEEELAIAFGGGEPPFGFGDLRSSSERIPVRLAILPVISSFCPSSCEIRASRLATSSWAAFAAFSASCWVRASARRWSRVYWRR
jgi:hypothetical protein